MSELLIGLMSGTSLDGVDAVLVDFAADTRFTVRGDYSIAYPSTLREEILALQNPGHNELHRNALLANALADLYAVSISGLLQHCTVATTAIRAIGCHGQTVRHAPWDGYTLQTVNLARLAEHCQIDVIGDFRSRDVAAGGHGAPLVPAFHQAAFAHKHLARVIVNIGGISNLTLLLPGQPVSGFDCGPGNMLMDAWCRRHLHKPFDENGQWAATGKVNPALLTALLEAPFFAAAPPKSTGRELFSIDWLDNNLAGFAALSAADVQATLCALTVAGISQAITRFAPSANEVFLCGGGALNLTLRQYLAGSMPDRQIADSQALGLSVQQVEATAFAWLAHQYLHRLPGNLPEATGAQGLRMLGALYPH